MNTNVKAPGGQGLGTNYLLRLMSSCNELTTENLNYLRDIFQDPEAPNQARKRAAYKLRILWQEYDKRQARSAKAKATRARNKAQAAAKKATEAALTIAGV